MFSKGRVLDLFAFEFPLAQTLGPESIHNIYNVPLELEPERAAKARRAVVASYFQSEVTISEIYSGFFWTFRKKLKAKKTQAEKKLKQIFEKLKQIIQKLNNSPTKTIFFSKSPEFNGFRRKVSP